MIIEGTKDEISYLLLQCQKRRTCDDCILSTWCNAKDNKSLILVSKILLKESNKKYGPGYQTVFIGDNKNEKFTD